MEEFDFITTEKNGIIISARPTLVEEGADNSLFGYYLCIENQSNTKVSLLGKHWNITDDRGNRYSDDSVGFKGEIPELEPGEFFEFTSTAPLSSANAVFYGSINLADDNGVSEFKIPTFSFTKKSSVRPTFN